MHISSHLPPSHAAYGWRPDHAGNSPGRPQQGQPAAAQAAPPASAAETVGAVAATEESGEANGPGNSVAHRARAQLAGLSGPGGHNFGWLVSQIAQGTFDAAAYAAADETSEGGDTENVVAGSGEAGETATETASDATEDATASDEAAAAREADATDPADALLDETDSADDSETA